MSEFVITTETNSEIPWQYAKEHNIPVFRMPYTVDGVEADYDLGENTDFIAFFEKLKNGAQAATYTKSPYDVEKFFREQLDKGLDVLHLGFSSQLSAHFSICTGLLETLRADYPKQRIEMIDTMRISMPMGLIVMEAIDLKEAGKSLQEIYDWVQPRSEDDMKIALERFKYEGILLTTYESILFELTKGAKAPEFRVISKLVK